jgi:hypothetical protein
VAFESFKMAAIFKMATIVPRNISNGMHVQIDHCVNFAWNDVNKRSISAQYFDLIYLRACDKWKVSTIRGQPEDVWDHQVQIKNITQRVSSDISN